MRTIYVDSHNMCHADDGRGRTPIQTDALDGICDKALEFYLCKDFDGELFIQCIDTRSADAFQNQYTEDCDNMMSLADVADIVELVYEDDLGIIG